jgi:hypothetical protein
MYNSNGTFRSFPDDVYRYINISESGVSDPPKRKPLRIVFEPFIFTLVLLLFLTIIASFIYYLVILLPPILLNFNTLISNTLPNELQYYHSIIAEHNQTLSGIESNILHYLNISNILVNPENLDRSVHILRNMDRITSALNVTQVQQDLDSIVNTLNRILPHG